MKPSACASELRRELQLHPYSLLKCSMARSPCRRLCVAARLLHRGIHSGTSGIRRMSDADQPTSCAWNQSVVPDTRNCASLPAYIISDMVASLPKQPSTTQGNKSFPWGGSVAASSNGGGGCFSVSSPSSDPFPSPSEIRLRERSEPRPLF
jgi:hypothetical protein